jgi:hypothetical protein
MGAVRRRLSYANVVATVALFLALGGGVVWAAGKIGAKGLKANAVTAGKIKRNAVTNQKIRANAVTAPKVKNGAIGFAKLAAGTNLIASASGGPVPVSSAGATAVPLTGATSFTPQPGTLYLLSVEAKGGNLQRVGEEACRPTVVPFVNGSEWLAAGGPLAVSAFKPTADRPTGLAPLAATAGPIGLTSPGVAETVAAKVFGDPDCAAGSTVSVAIAVTQMK